MQCLAGPVPYQSSIHSRCWDPIFPREWQGWAAVHLGPQRKPGAGLGAIQVENLSIRTPCQAMSRKDLLREKWGSDACAWNLGPQLTAHFLSSVPSLRFSGVPLAVFCSPCHWHIAVEACNESPTAHFLHPQSSIPHNSRDDVCEAPSTQFCPQHTSGVHAYSTHSGICS